MQPFWSSTVDAFLQASTDSIVGHLAQLQIRHFRVNAAQQLRAWEASIFMLKRAFGDFPAAARWRVLLEYPMLRLGSRPDVILLASHAIFVLEIKAGATDYHRADRRQVEDYAIDLHDFHAGSRTNPIIPVLVAEDAPDTSAPLPLLLGRGVARPVDANAQNLPVLLRNLHLRTQHIAGPLDAEEWLSARYAPVPTIVDAACMLYAKHGVKEIREARADATNLSETTTAILSEIATARAAGQRLILFVTGIPGAGKTLCGLDVIFSAEDEGRGTYLTGNPTLVHVLREALTRDAVIFGAKRRDAEQRMTSAIQALPKFRDQYVANPAHLPAEQIVVIDEAQRCWSAAWAIAKTRDKAIRLTCSEPVHLLEIMARHDGFCAIVSLVGNGQEIHAGEGGLAAWGDALREAAAQGTVWRVRAAPDLLTVTDPRQRLGPLPDFQALPSLHLAVPIRQVRSASAAAWVDFVLAGDVRAACAIARDCGDLPYLLTRDTGAMRRWLRMNTRGLRRAGLLASSGAARLRADGLGVELPHMEAKAVARWFLNRFPEDVRASDALEVVATEFSCQGLELDYVGLCWDADLIREPNQRNWTVRNFRGSAWQRVRQAEAIANQLNTYRVLLTRARYETIIFVPLGNSDDPTRTPALYDAIADFLGDCGVRTLDDQPDPERDATEQYTLV